MELRHLRYFEALAETLNFTRAAERVHVTQSTLSHQIRQLEEELGHPLFDRIGKRVSMTEAGETLLLHIAPALRQVDRAIHAVRDEQDLLVGEVRVGATQSFNIQLIPQCVASFLGRYPSVRVIVEELGAADITARVADGTLDLGVSYRPTQTDALFFEPLYNEELKLVVNDRHPMAGRRRARMIELHGLRMVLLPPYLATRQLLDECFRAAGAEPQVIAELNSIAPMLELVRRTDIAAVIGESAETCDAGLRFIPLESPTPQRTPGLLWKRGAPRAVPVRFFATTVRRMVEGLGQKG
ncbi:LysR substrate-binding domain-containing protein [Cupriavidus numazuensis]|uniref:HTH-type transcriptional regulator CynR n=1 Tax=Cupriavidus numazuensis TaxID=221992 RepID=A0ABM8TNN7_9BURK|nr:LysR substrate-binding domain-containing protein [Cupriavidus numazuensis]CAG2156299.1 HTH-type transcriptional regulator CynR [Cupriavidus numazuensis]